MPSAQLLTGDALTVLRTLPDGVARCCITSPPYFGLRDYGAEGQLGLERTPEEYVARMVEVFREVRRVLSDDGTMWLNIGDSYASGTVGRNDMDEANLARRATLYGTGRGPGAGPREKSESRPRPDGLKSKDLVGIPWMLAFALRADGWYLRSEIIWAKPNPMPESVTDRPTKAHEQVFLLSKRSAYYYDSVAISEATRGLPAPTWDQRKALGEGPRRSFSQNAPSGCHRVGGGATRNARTVWEIATQPYSGAHFATFPEQLARRCLLAGSAPGDTVLDPFSGSGTTASVAVGNGRHAIGIELNPKYQELARQRIGPLLVA